MKTDTEILNSISGGESAKYLHQLTSEESTLLKNMLLLMYRDFTEVCEQNKLTYMLGGGSCLGAVRHKGFIPWDDDLDIMMPRKDYENLIKLLDAGILGEEYEINYPSKTVDSKNTFLKIYRKHTLDNELINESTPFPKGIFLDIFPMDYAPRSKYMRKIKGILSDGIQFIATCVLYAKYPSEKYRKFVSYDSTAKKRYKIRLIIGSLFKIIPHRIWVYWFDKFNKSSKETGFITIPTGRKHYFGETQKSSVFLPVKYTQFENITSPIPGNSDAYLKALYGNYMELPPEDKRERHFVYQFKCNMPE